MQCIILAAGASTRFEPFTKNFSHKSLVKVLGKPIIEHTIHALKKAGVNDVILVVSKKDEFVEILGNGSKFGLKLTYVILPEPLGMGAALLRAKEYLHETFFLTNSNHLEINKFVKTMKSMQNAENEIVLLGKKEKGFSDFGFMETENDRVTSIIEKPGKEISSVLRIVGIYLLNRKFVQTLEAVKEGHYNFEKALGEYAKERSIKYIETKETALSLKYVWDLFALKDYLLMQQITSISTEAQIADSAQIEGNVVVEKGAKILENAIIKGPAYIGKNAFVGSNAIVRNGTVVEEEGVIGAGLEAKNIILMERSTTHSGVLEDSIIGRDCKIAAGIITANVRLDRGYIFATVKGQKVSTGKTYLGIIISDNVQFGIRVSTMPGVIIGQDVIIGPDTVIMKNIPSNTKYYTIFREVIETEGNQ